jgi:hypothetical protein
MTRLLARVVCPSRPSRARARRVVVLLAVAGPLWLALPPLADAQWDVDPRRSLAVTEQPILDRFPLQRVLDQLVAQSGVRGLTSLELFQQWWDTQNPTPGLGLGPHCDDAVNRAGESVVNGFPYACRPAPAEGSQATSDPFANPDTNPAAYLPIGLFNRFDLAPGDGSHCGEHRIVYARRSGLVNGLNRNLLIFEASLPNPQPRLGLRGCYKIAKFWADLTSEPNIFWRADALERFFFDGIKNIGPVVHVNNFGHNRLGAGQIRTNQFMQMGAAPLVWSLREFKLIRTCHGRSCSALTMVPVTNKENPFGPLFSPTGTDPRTSKFQAYFVSQVAGLAAANLMAIDIDMPNRFNSGQSLSLGSTETNYRAQFGPGPSPLRSDLEAALAALNSALTPDDVVARAQALSCAGCHQLSNNAPVGNGLVWPSSLGFTHVSEQVTETVDGVTRFAISNALLSVFLPKRKQVLDDFLNQVPRRPKYFGDPIGGRRVH